ncbi:calmin isoform X2 [Ambystoma mexicanum]|uniref:calmin isoform X2 n=1 Tax=Ambystoma mexicanum TaxID=8296 RepID=UPI0037E6F8B2
MEHTKELHVERETVQMRTFTKWMNLHLKKCDPPLQVHNLCLDIQDGKILMALLEVMSGQRLLHEYKSSSHRIFRLNNIAKSLKFLEDSNVKLVSIDAAEIADGNPSMVLGLIWNIILFFQIKELTGNLNRNASSSSLSSIPSGTDSDTSHPSTPNTEKSMSVSTKVQRKTIKALLHWVQQRTRKYGVAVQDFASSWRSGLAFLAVIKAVNSSLVDMRDALDKTPRENVDNAFRIAFDSLNIPRLLEPEDIMVDNPDEQSIMTYVAQFLEHFPEMEGEDLSEAVSPVESTFVHYKDGPVEEEGKIVFFNQNEEYAYTVNHDILQSPPPKIFVCSVPEALEEYSLQKSNENQNDHSPFSLNDETQSLAQQKSLQSTESAQGGPDLSWECCTNNLTTIHKSLAKHSYSQTINEVDSQYPDPSDEHVVDSVDPSKCSNMAPINRFVGTPTFAQDSSERTLSLSSFNNVNSLLGTDAASHKPANQHLLQKQIYPVKGTGSQDSTLFEENVSPVTPTDEEEAYRYILHLHDDGPKMLPKPLGCEHPHQITALQEKQTNMHLIEDATQRDQADLFRSSGSESAVSLSRKIPETLNIHTGHRATPKSSQGSAKVSVIPHNLFYYPHYSVPIADVLDAFVESSSKESENILQEHPLHFSIEHSSDIPTSKNTVIVQSLPKTTIEVSPTKVEKETLVTAIIETLWNDDHEEVGSENQISSSQYTKMNQTAPLGTNPGKTLSRFSLEVEASGVREKHEQCKVYDNTSRKKEDSTCSEEARIPNYLKDVENHIEDASQRMEQEVNGLKKSGKITAMHQEVDVQDTKNDIFPNLYDLEKKLLEDLSSSRFVQEAQMSVRATPTYEYHFRRQHSVDLLYLILFLWMLVYSVMILPELDLSKVTFFSNDQ